MGTSADLGGHLTDTFELVLVAPRSSGGDGVLGVQSYAALHVFYVFCVPDI